MEWTLDSYSKDGHKNLATLADKKGKGLALTVWPATLFPRAVRGGSFEMTAEEARSAARLGSNREWFATDPNLPKSPWWLTDEPARGVGMRVIRPLDAPSKEELVKCWESDCEATESSLKIRLKEGRGAIGVLKEVPAKKK